MAEIKSINLNGSNYDIKDELYETFTYQYTATSIAANGTVTLDPTNSIPNGYQEVGILGFDTSGPLFVLRSVSEYGRLVIHNYAGESGTLTPVLKVRIHKL